MMNENPEYITFPGKGLTRKVYYYEGQRLKWYHIIRKWMIRKNYYKAQEVRKNGT